ncbi:hypothetical protein BC936DRAFT_142077 [Jimgerdemannia flammicorona]|uniref:Uncharacterized protein n=1 Tax=Jimgerdemannia flammicorona TaxID=994334 RepID=A0A433DFI5_9FUNG|nr:hypothetical protein BC936DRAFT_142077 [Jimgerdemannia flammicorona]
MKDITLYICASLGIIPISRTQDSVRPMTRNTLDAAIVLSVIAGPDPGPAMLARGAGISFPLYKF